MPASAEYYDRVNNDLLRLIPPDARVVLEIGCGAGALAAAYRRVNPAAEWLGVEMDLAAFAAAEKRMTRCFHGPIEGFEGGLANLIKPPDVIVCGDVLEHLVDPWRALTWLAKLAAPGAQVLACAPNVGHWTVIRDLLAGRWRYQDEGLLDRTHVRFFTRESLQEMFAAAGLHVFEVRGRDIANAGYLTWISENFGGNDPGDYRNLAAYQFVVRAVKGEPSKPLHIHAVTSQTVCVPVRIEQPLAALRTVPGVRVQISDSGSDRLSINLDWDTVIILQRITEKPACYVEAVAELLACPRCVVVYEIDDDPEAAPGIVACDYLPLRLCHAVQCSTEVVAGTVRRHNPDVAVFPNQIWELPEPREDRLDGPVVLFFGALNRGADWAPIMPALNRVLKDHPDVFVKVVHDHEFFEALETKRKSYDRQCDYPTYLSILRSCDIALLPLEPTRFNEHKSDLKFLECAANGVVALMSSTAFDGILSDRITYQRGPMAEVWIDPPVFEQALRELITNADRRQFDAENAYDYVKRRRMLGQHYRRRLDWYRDLIRSRAALDRRLRERCPELASLSARAPLEPGLTETLPSPA
jgi:SAM-dependent methyltransferase